MATQLSIHTDSALPPTPQILDPYVDDRRSPLPAPVGLIVTTTRAHTPIPLQRSLTVPAIGITTAARVGQASHFLPPGGYQRQFGRQISSDNYPTTPRPLAKHPALRVVLPEASHQPDMQAALSPILCVILINSFSA